MWEILLCISHYGNSKEVKAKVKQACFLSVYPSSPEESSIRSFADTKNLKAIVTQ